MGVDKMGDVCYTIQAVSERHSLRGPESYSANLENDTEMRKRSRCELARRLERAERVKIGERVRDPRSQIRRVKRREIGWRRMLWRVSEEVGLNGKGLNIRV